MGARVRRAGRGYHGVALEDPTARRIEIKSERAEDAAVASAIAEARAAAAKNDRERGGDQNQSWTSSASISLLTRARRRDPCWTGSPRPCVARTPTPRRGPRVGLGGERRGMAPARSEGEEAGAWTPRRAPPSPRTPPPPPNSFGDRRLAAPMVTASRWDRAARVNVALGTLYDRLEARKERLPPAARHVVAAAAETARAGDGLGVRVLRR